jgi:DNA polymerase-3 subunit epsilon
LATPAAESVRVAASAARSILSPRRRALLALAAATLLGLAAFAGLVVTQPPPARLAAILSAAVVGFGGAAGLLWLALERFWLRPAERLAAETRFAAETRAEGGVAAALYAGLAPLPEAIEQLLAKYLAADRDTERAVGAATARVEEQKRHLEAILRDLSEGVLVCNLEHRVLLYNQAALTLLHVTGELGLARSLFNLVTPEPVLHALERLAGTGGIQAPATQPVPVVCATLDGRTLLSARMGIVLDAHARASGYVLTFVDVTQELGERARRDALLRAATEGLRGPVANLLAAAETLATYPEMAPDQRRSFGEVVLRESAALSRRLEALDRDFRAIGAGPWPMADIHSADLFRCLARTLGDEGGPTLTPVGLPLWLHADSHSLVLALDRLVRNLAEATGARSFDAEALLGDRRSYVEISWEGAPVSSATLDRWAKEPLPGVLGSATLGDVLLRHGSEMWSRPQRPGRALLRIPVPAPHRLAVETRPASVLPPRPEFYDFDLLHLGGATAQGERPLRSLAYVVFDTETTGLRPSDGDEIVSIGAVRVVNGRILTGETFARLVNPKRPIPKDSIRFHGITDAMVATAPPAEIVLPQFKGFVADSVLVAFNAAFDLKFLRLKEDVSGVRFDNVPLDVLLIAAFLFEDLEDLSLDALAARLGVEISGRHSALGDAIGTAAVFVRLLERLEARGIETLEALLGASKMAYEIRARAARF